jgi:Uma2 family endonuclease
MSTAAFSVDSFDHLIAVGGLKVEDDCRVELIRGTIAMMSPAADPEHDAIIDLLMEWSVAITPRDRVQVRIQNAIGLPELDSVLIPDVAWVKRGNYREIRPDGSQVLLAIEVARSSLARDRGEKGAIYAEGGVADFWIVNLREQMVEVYRQPHGDGYEDVAFLGKDDAVAPLALPEVQLSVADLWHNA